MNVKYRLRIRQPQDGYRYSIDSILTAEFVQAKAGSKILEIGAGCGVISLIIAKRFPDATIHAIEIQEGLFRFLKENIKHNQLQNRIKPVLGDIKKFRKLFQAGIFDHIVTNPPFRNPSAGRICLDSQEALARHEILVNMDDILSAAAWLLRYGGRLSIIYPAERLSLLLCKMTGAKIEPKRLRCVHPSKEVQARMVLVQGIKGAGEELRVEPPLLLNNSAM